MEAPHQHSDTPNALPAGTRLGEFELLSLLGVGGFGIVYLAFDHALEREVAVKEYMPASLAGRTETMHVSLRSQSDADTFAMGRRHFVQEAKMLAQFDHPSLLKVYRYWEANGTAYMAMPVMRGRTLRDTRLAMAGPPDEAWVRGVLGPLLGAIERLHSQDVYHRDIAPDNILIETDGRPVLLDFGAARRVLSDKSQTLTAILKPAYAPIEQYAEAGSVRQGPWTDIYALGATLHFLLLSRPPAPATARAIHDELSQLTTDALPGFSANFLHIVDWMLAPRPNDRPQSVAALREVLDGTALPPRRRALEAAPPSQWDRTVLLAPGAGGAPPTAAPEAATLVVPAPVPVPPPVVASPKAAPAVPPAPAAVAPPLLPARSRLSPVGLGVLAATAVAVAIAAAVFWPRAVPVSTPLASAPSASAASASVAVATPAAPTTVPASSTPESAIATVVVPGAAPTRPLTTSPDAMAAAGRPATPATGRLAGDARAQASRPSAAVPLPAASVAVAAAPVPAVETPRPVRAETPPPVASAPAPAPVAVKPVVTGPEATCGGRNPLRYFVCMERECLRSELAGHADCLKWRKEAKQRE